MASMAVMGLVGWLMLVVPELHFLYKHLIPALGIAKYVAFFVMGIAMFVCLPITLIHKSFILLMPMRCKSPIEKCAMGLLCALSVLISRNFM